MKNIWNKYFKDIKTQLTFGISAIVFVSTLIIGVLFLTLYRNSSLKQAEIELYDKATKIVNLASSFESSFMPNARQRFLSSLRNFTESDFWITDKTGKIIIATEDVQYDNNIISINNSFLSKIEKNKTIITYEYSNFMGTKTLTVIVPLIERNMITGIVLLHKDVNIIYNSYTSFIILVIVCMLISFVLSITLGIIYSNYFTKPIKKITDIAKSIKMRNYDIKTNIDRNDEIGELANTIDQMTVDIKNNITEIKELENRAKELVANVSHEFKTPLTLIRGYAMNLEEGVIEANKEIYEKIINNTKVLEKLVNELLELNRYQSGNVTLNIEKISLKQLVEDVTVDMKNIAQLKNISINIISDLDILFEADYIKMRQMLTIFIDNAIKFSNNDSVIEIAVLEDMLTIKDNGIGIEKSKLEQLFERYYQVNDNELGYGLGLCIAKYIADHHNFVLNIESDKGKGTIVKIKLK